MSSTPQTADRWELLRAAEFSSSRWNFNPGTLGTPAACVEAARAAFQVATEGWPLGQYVHGREAAGRARALISTVGTPGPAALGAGTTVTTTLIAHRLRAHLGRPGRILTTAHEHPGGIGAFAHTSGAEVIEAPDHTLDDPDAFAALVATNPPDVLFLSQTLWTTGRTIPVEALATAVRAVSPEVWVVVDAAQVVGVADIAAKNADFVVASGHKWLAGSPGTGMLWVGERAQRELGGLGWGGELFDASPLCRFEVGGGQDFGRWAGFEAALALHRELGTDTIAARGRTVAEFLARRLHAELNDVGIGHHFASGGAWTKEPVTQGPVVVVRFDEADPYPVYTRLEAARVHVKCIKHTLSTGERLSHLRWGVNAWESYARLDEAAGHFRRALR